MTSYLFKMSECYYQTTLGGFFNNFVVIVAIFNFQLLLGNYHLLTMTFLDL